MSDNHEQENITNNDKPKDPKKVAWGKKMGQMNKGKKKILTEESTSNYSMYYTPLIIGGIGLAAFVWYYTRNAKTEVDIPVTSKQNDVKKKNLQSKLEI